eukprot:10710992-Lingulodinium_polyedra.AAC.1
MSWGVAGCRGLSWRCRGASCEWRDRHFWNLSREASLRNGFGSRPRSGRSHGAALTANTAAVSPPRKNP